MGAWTAASQSAQAGGSSRWYEGEHAGRRCGLAVRAGRHLKHRKPRREPARWRRARARAARTAQAGTAAPPADDTPCLPDGRRLRAGRAASQTPKAATRTGTMATSPSAGQHAQHKREQQHHRQTPHLAFQTAAAVLAQFTTETLQLRRQRDAGAQRPRDRGSEGAGPRAACRGELLEGLIKRALRRGQCPQQASGSARLHRDGPRRAAAKR